ncbi:MAG: Oxidoreductase, aldo/keto reductase family [uncultured Thermomicrobiales bacterium]|uniref:Oxidoreductase, aldo/keto reductase family n=1 Tax=uncultured Thermomicrobiales bacterium TaxID=1645740 RepID=A0A6J4TZF3_9BACT|nr:MAG: Oxidoreductase, aldo/keto reductase family [uncultured Thermomicrobiales bacterium]
MSATDMTTVPRRPLGTTGEQVSILGVGGAHMGQPEEAEGIRIVHAAIDAGMDFLDNAWEYNDGVSEERMGKALAQGGYRQRAFLMTKNCDHQRTAAGSLANLEESLRRLRTDYLDLWQVHEVAWDTDPERILAPGGAAEAMLKAKEQGKVRYIGFTGHKDPNLHRALLSQGFPWDTVQLPLNALDYHYRSFEREIVPLCEAQGIGVIGMKSLAGGHLLKSGADLSAEEAIRYSLSLPCATLVSGMDSLATFEANLAIARAFVPYGEAELDAIRARTAQAAADGRFEPFKTTRDFEGDVGRKANDYPLQAAD